MKFIKNLVNLILGISLSLISLLVMANFMAHGSIGMRKPWILSLLLSIKFLVLMGSLENTVSLAHLGSKIFDDYWVAFLFVFSREVFIVVLVSIEKPWCWTQASSRASSWIVYGVFALTLCL